MKQGNNRKHFVTLVVALPLIALLISGNAWSQEQSTTTGSPIEEVGKAVKSLFDFVEKAINTVTDQIAPRPATTTTPADAKPVDSAVPPASSVTQTQVVPADGSGASQDGALTTPTIITPHSGEALAKEQPAPAEKQTQGTPVVEVPRSHSGVLEYPDGSVYEGEIVSGLAHGKGVRSFYSGARYQGDFVNGKRHGRGSYTFPDGARYDGAFLEDQRTGKGILVWPNGDRYDGDFIDGKRTGRGVYVWPNGTRYEGGFFDGKKVGKGILAWNNGNYYEGNWIDDERTGRGTYAWSDGRRYEGDFVDNKLTNGVITHPDGRTQHVVNGVAQQAPGSNPPQAVASSRSSPPPAAASNSDESSSVGLALLGGLLTGMLEAQTQRSARQANIPPAVVSSMLQPPAANAHTPPQRPQGTGACRTEVGQYESRTICPDGTVTVNPKPGSSASSQGSGNQSGSGGTRWKPHLEANQCLSVVKKEKFFHPYSLQNNCGHAVTVTYCYENRQKDGSTYGWCKGQPPVGALAKSIGPRSYDAIPFYPGGRVFWMACRGSLGEVTPALNSSYGSGCS